MERKTRQYEAIIDVIANAGRPLLASEIMTLAQNSVPQLSLATVYRSIKSLQEDGSIKPVLLPGQNPRYEMFEQPHEHAHHHHFQCRACERVFALDACPGNLEKIAPNGFTVEAHEIILYGRCKQCTETAL